MGSWLSSIKFYWELIKEGLLPLFTEFHMGNLPIYSLNFGTITLLLKQKVVTQIQ